MRPTCLALILAATCAGSATAQSRPPTDQLLANVSRELPQYLPDVDASTLSRTQLGALYVAMHANGSSGNRLAQIRSIVGGRHSLRGVLLNH
ncbi:MAG: hypothetical protein LJE68_16670 [Rhodobacter sp.]|nr:hypothetical protein [Rhodobacter sp.]